MLSEAGIAPSVTLCVFDWPALIVTLLSCAALIAWPVAPFASYVTMVNESVPGGVGGPLTVQPLLQEPAATFVTAGLPLIVVGSIPTESAVSVIFTDSVALEMNCGVRPLADVVRAGMRMMNCGVTKL